MAVEWVSVERVVVERVVVEWVAIERFAVGMVAVDRVSGFFKTLYIFILGWNLFTAFIAFVSNLDI